MVDHITGWFEKMQYKDKKAMMIVKLVEFVWLVGYPCPVKIAYDQGGEFLVHEFKNSFK